MADPAPTAATAERIAPAAARLIRNGGPSVTSSALVGPLWLLGGEAITAGVSVDG